jgi:adenylosuccinate synthase
MPGQQDKVAIRLQKAISERQKILVEGHQGFGLSNYHGDYPYTSSRDSTAAAMLSELGIGPSNNLEVVLVVKAFPTRNHAGKLEGEITPQEAAMLGICEEGGGAWGIPNRRRRVGLFDLDLVSEAVIANTPSYLVLTGGDYLDRDLRSATRYVQSDILDSVIARLNETAGPDRSVRLVSSGPATHEMFELLRKSKGKPPLNSDLGKIQRNHRQQLSFQEELPF